MHGKHRPPPAAWLWLWSLLLLPACGGEGDLPTVDPSALAENRPVTPAEKQTWFPGETFHDGGKVEEGEKIVRTFPFRNPANLPRKILSLQKNCACAWTHVEYGGRTIKAVSPLVPPLVIPPGGEGKIEVVLDTTGIDGPKTATVLVHTDDPENRWLRLSVKAVSLLFFWPEPRESGLGEIGSADRASFSFLVKSKRVERWRILRCQAPPGYTVGWERTSWGGRDAWRVRGTVGPGLAPGDHSATLVLHTDHQDRRINFPVKLSVRPPWEVDPPGPLNFGRIKRGRSRSLEFVVRTLTLKRKLKIESLRLAKVDRDRKHFRIVPRPTVRNRRYDVTFTALGTLAPGPFAGRLLVRTADPEVPEKEIPFHGYVR